MNTQPDPLDDFLELVRNLLAEHDAADAPAALAAHLADTYRMELREVGPRYALAGLETGVSLAANAWHQVRAKYGPRATWSRERGHHAATISTIIEDVTR